MKSVAAVQSWSGTDPDDCFVVWWCGLVRVGGRCVPRCVLDGRL